MSDDQGEKSEEATEARRDEFRQRGQVAHTKELATSMLLLASAIGIMVFGKYFLRTFYDIFNSSLGIEMVEIVRTGKILDGFSLAAQRMSLLILPALALSAALGIGATVMQVGFMQVEDAISPDLDRINPLEGFKRLFSFRAVIEVFKSLIKMVGVGFAIYLLLKGEIQKVPNIINLDTAGLITYVGMIIVKLLSGLGGLMLAISGMDYFLQRWDLEKKMMMTKQEIKEEHKQREGDPLIKSRIRKIQRDMANKRMMSEIPKATVVVTNPTHIAVVLKYDSNLAAPQLVAKGGDHMAEKIKGIAREHNIPIIENKPLARTIFKTMKIGQVIPRELFVAVAEVLSYIYKLRKKVRR